MKEWPCTAEEIIHLRDELGLSWLDISKELGLGKGKKAPARFARLAYRDLTGRHWKDAPSAVRSPRSVPPERRKTASSVHWDDDTDQEEIELALMGREVETKDGIRWFPKRLLVRRELNGMSRNEEILCRYATAFSYGPNGDQPLQVDIVEHIQKKNFQGTQMRTLFVNKILRVT